MAQKLENYTYMTHKISSLARAEKSYCYVNVLEKERGWEGSEREREREGMGERDGYTEQGQKGFFLSFIRLETLILFPGVK